MFWKLANPFARRFGGVLPFWVVLETTGRRSGRPRLTPLARGPIDDSAAWLISVHGEHASFARNIAARPRVRLKHRGRWREGTARVLPLETEQVRRFNLYARSATWPGVGIDPRLIRVDFDSAKSEKTS